MLQKKKGNQRFTPCASDKALPIIDADKMSAFRLTPRASGKALWITIFILIAVLIFSCTRGRGEQPISGTRTYLDFVDTGKRIGVESGDVYGDLALQLFNAKSVVENLNVADLFESLRRGRIDAILMGDNYLSLLRDSGIYSDFEYLWVPENLFLKEASFVFHTESLRDQYNEWFETIYPAGTYQEIYNRWLLGNIPRPSEIPTFDIEGENGILRIADTGNYPPLSYLDSQGNSIGFGPEMIYRFSEYLGMKPEFSQMPYENIVPSVTSGRFDMSAATMSLPHSIPSSRTEFGTTRGAESDSELFFGEPCIFTRAVLIVPRGQRLGIDLVDFSGERMAVLTGSYTYSIAQKIGAIPVNYDVIEDAINDVRMGRIFGFMSPFSFIRSTAFLSGEGVFDVLVVPADIDRTLLGAFSMNQELVDSFNTFFEEIRFSGLLSEMQNKWFTANVDFSNQIEPIINTGENGVLRVVVNSDAIPFVFVNNFGDYSGYSAELALRFGAYLGRRIEFIDVPFNDLIPYVERGQADFCIDKIGITEQRHQRVIFTTPIYSEHNGILFLSQRDRESDSIDDYRKFIGSRIGMSIGSLAEGVTINHLRGVPVLYSNYSASIEDIRRNRISGYMSDLSTLNILVTLPENQDLVVYDIPGTIFNAPIAAFSHDQEIIDKFNSFLADLEGLGMLQEMQNRWFSGVPDLDTRLHTLSNVGTHGVLRVATIGDKPPYAFIGADGELHGFSIELARLFATSEGKMIRFAEMSFDAILPYINDKRADIGIANVGISPTRREIVLFSDPIHYDRFGIIALGTQASSLNLSENHPLVLTDFNGKRIGLTRGTIFDKYTSEVINGIPVYYNDFNIALADMETGRLDGYMVNDFIAQLFEQETTGLLDIIYLEPRELFTTRIAAISLNQELINSFNIFLQEIIEDGTLQDIQNRWIKTPITTYDSQLTDYNSQLTTYNSRLRIITSGTTRPFSFYNENSEPVGFSIEIAKRFAANQEMEIEIIFASLDRLIDQLIIGRADMAFDLFQIPEEPLENIYYTEPFLYGNATLVAIRSISIPKRSFVANGILWFKNGIQRNLLTDNRWQLLLDGFYVTMIIAVFAQIIGTILGIIVFFFMTRSAPHKKNINNQSFLEYPDRDYGFVEKGGKGGVICIKPLSILLKWVFTLYYELICRMPKVVLLLVSYYILFNKTGFSNTLIAVFAFSMLASSNVAKVLRHSLIKLDATEIEAATLLGFTKFQRIKFITIPQLIKHSIVTYTKDFIELLKATAIVGYIAIQDLTRAGEIIRSRTFDAIFPLLSVTLVYLIVISICIYLFRKLAEKVEGVGGRG